MDLRLIRDDDKLAFDIFRKPTDAPLCIPNDSHHTWRHKVAAFESALFRMWNVPLTKERRQKELDFLIEMAQTNGYNKRMVLNLNQKYRMRNERKRHTLLRPVGRKVTEPGTQRNNGALRKGFLTIPYHSRMTNCLSNKLKSNGLSVVYQNKGSLKNLIGRVKRRRPKTECSGIYNIKCDNCEGNYVGQTKRRVETREKEHVRAVKLNQPSKSALAAHCLEEGHNKGECQVLKEVKNPFHLDAWESLFIAKGEDLVNTGEPPIRSKLFEYASIEKYKSF